MANLSEQEREEIISAIRAGRTVPERYRASLFEDAPETELIWPGKSNEVERVVLPFQSIEHIDEPRAETVVQPSWLSIDATSGRQISGWTNKLIWGDNKLILSSLTNGPLRKQVEEAGGLKLIYIDPPFDVGSDFSVDVEIGDGEVSKQPSVVEEVAYRDTWGKGRDSFLAMISDRLRLMIELLSPNGIIAVHSDWRLSHHIRCLLDEMLGPDRFVNEVIWHYDYGARGRDRFGKKHDTIAVYSKSDQWTFHAEDVLVPYESGMTEWRYTRGGQAGKEMPKGKIPSDVWDIKLNAMSKEHLSYPTQKPEALIERFVLAFSSPGDLVADFFVGSGTTAAVAERLGRKWIAADLGRFAIHTTRKRLIAVQRQLASEGKPYRAFEILNLGNYERQYFAGVDMSLPDDQRREDSAQRQEQYLNLVLQAYGAQRSDQLLGFHGVKDKALVYVGPLDAPITQSDVRNAIDMAKKHGVTRLDVIGFEFEMGIKPAMADDARDEGLVLTLRYIPNDVFDRRAVQRGSVKFFDVGYVEVKPKQDQKGLVTVEITDFGVFYAQDDADAAAIGLQAGGARVVIDSGQVVRVAKDKKGVIKKEILTKSWRDWIDYWAVDFDYESQKEIVATETGEASKANWTGRYIFENQWQDYRTKDVRTIKTLSAPHRYDTPGEYKIAIKVVDVFGNDTTKVIKFRVK